MNGLLTIGEFSRATHLSIKALRHYDGVGLLVPATVDDRTGYRRYSTAQVPTAQLIRRFRDLDMPIDQVRLALDANDRDQRDRVILSHLEQMQHRLEQTQDVVASLRALLAGDTSPPTIDYRRGEPEQGFSVSEASGWEDAEAWLGTAFERLHAELQEAGVESAGPDGALYSTEFFEAHAGEVVAFVPVHDPVTVPGRARLRALPVGAYAVTVHVGPFADIDRAYARLGTFVAERMIGTDGPIRENYLATTGEARTEVCWPVIDPRP